MNIPAHLRWYLHRDESGVYLTIERRADQRGRTLYVKNAHRRWLPNGHALRRYFRAHLPELVEYVLQIGQPVVASRTYDPVDV